MEYYLATKVREDTGDLQVHHAKRTRLHLGPVCCTILLMEHSGKARPGDRAGPHASQGVQWEKPDHREVAGDNVLYLDCHMTVC